MILVQDEPLGRSWRCGLCDAEIAENFGKPEIPVDRIYKGESDAAGI